MSFNDDDSNFDMLAYALGKFTELKTFTLPWQPNITSLEKCSTLPNHCKMMHFTLIQIPAIIPPAEIAAFANQHCAENGYMCLSFLIPTTQSYYEKIKSLISSKKFQLRIKHEPAQPYILHR